MKLKIAVCDDDLQWSERIRQSISEYMCHVNQQCDIQVFESGEELCGAFHGSHSFDIVFLDVDMDEMDGMETAEMIRSRSDQVTIVFITGVVEAAPRGYQYGAMRYIMKQDIEELLPECLGSFLKQYKLTFSTPVWMCLSTLNFLPEWRTLIYHNWFMWRVRLVNYVMCLRIKCWNCMIILQRHRNNWSHMVLLGFIRVFW